MFFLCNIRNHYLFATIVFFSAINFSFAQTTDLIISEYVEGSSNNKYLEIYNGTGSSVNLSDYEIRIYSNGASSATSIISLSGTLANGAVYVIANSSATIWSGTPDLSTGSLNFNGDDAVELYKISTASTIDLFGNIGCDPGTAWTSGSYSTKDRTLVRDSSVCSGITADNPISCPFTTLNTEWYSYSQDDVSHLGTHTANCICTPLTEPTTPPSNLTVSNIQCYQADISWTNGNGNNRIVVVSVAPITGTPTDQTAYTANNNFGSGSTIAPTQYVVYNGSGNNSVVLGLSSNTTYYVAVFEYNGSAPNCDENYLTTLVSTSFTTASNCACPEIKSILVNACSTAEGTDEYIIYQNGNFDTYVDSLSITFPSAGTWCNNGCGANTLLNNATYINQLNTLAGCPGLFVYSDTIPANAQVIVFTGNPPSFTMDFSSQCGAGPFYAIFCNNSSTSGRFANSSNANRTTTISFSSTCSDTVTFYSSSANTGIDGDYVDFDAAGNPYYKNNPICAVPLPVEYLYFYGKITQNNTILLSWATATEINNDYFVIEHSIDGIHFSSIGKIPGNGTSNYINEYKFSFEGNTGIVNYFRLKQVDFDGKYEYSGIIVVTAKKGNTTQIYFNTATNTVHFSSPLPNGQLFIHDVSGKLVFTKTIKHQNRIPVEQLSAGIYVITVHHNDQVSHLKIAIP